MARIGIDFFVPVFKAIPLGMAFSIALRRGNVLQNFLAGFGGVGGACAVITLCLKIWPGALESLATGLYAHVNPELAV